MDGDCIILIKKIQIFLKQAIFKFQRKDAANTVLFWCVPILNIPESSSITIVMK